VRQLSTERAPAAIGPYSQAIDSGDYVFVSGQLGLHPATGELPPDTEGQARQALANMLAVLAAAGLGPPDLCRVGIFMVDLAEFATVNRIYEEALAGARPARSTVGVAALPRGARIEVEAIARRERGG
jgi:2-iminobutanoate/2-iminopropanoate deaminase